MYSIGEFSKLSGLSINTLRHYEAVRVLMPDKVNEITIKRVEPIMVVSTRREIVKGAFQEESKMWEIVDKFIKTNKVQQTIPCMALYHSGTWDWDATKKWDVEVAEPITKAVEGNDVVSVRELPMTEKMACIVHHGSLSNIGDTYKAIVQWIEQNNYSIAGPVREIYHVGEWAASNEEEYVTELQFPLDK